MGKNSASILVVLFCSLANFSALAHEGTKIPGDYLTAKPKSTLQREILREEMDKAIDEATQNTSGGHPGVTIRAVPNLQNEKVVGIKILAVRKSYFFEKIGMQKGDIWLSLNGIPVDSKNPFTIEQWKKNPLTYRVWRNEELVEIQVEYK